MTLYEFPGPPLTVKVTIPTTTTTITITTITTITPGPVGQCPMSLPASAPPRVTSAHSRAETIRPLKAPVRIRMVSWVANLDHGLSLTWSIPGALTPGSTLPSLSAILQARRPLMVPVYDLDVI